MTSSMKTAVVTVALLGCSVIAGLLFAAPLDNRLGFFAGRDLRILEEQSPEGRPIADLLRDRLRSTRCTAYHVDNVFQTIVECEGSDQSGSRVVLVWEVSHFYSPHPKIPRKGLFLCAMSRDAARLTPALMPPGMRLSDYPDQPLYYSAAVYGIASGRWIGGDPQRLTPDENNH